MAVTRLVSMEITMRPNTITEHMGDTIMYIMKSTMVSMGVAMDTDMKNIMRNMVTMAIMVIMATMTTTTTMIIPTTRTATMHTDTLRMRPGLTRVRAGLDTTPQGDTLWTCLMEGLRWSPTPWTDLKVTWPRLSTIPRSLTMPTTDTIQTQS